MISEPIPTNLKERIAALQQRNVSPPSQRAPSPASSLATTLNAPPPGSVAALRDKIARFEKKGGVPVPRGSLGMGAPSPVENGQVKKRGELYGNRIPSQVTGGSIRVASQTTGSSGPFPPSSMPSSPNSLSNRRFSMSQVEVEGNFDDMTHSSKLAGNLPTRAEDSIAKNTCGAEGSGPEKGIQPSFNTPEGSCRVSAEGSITNTPAAPVVSQPTRETPVAIDAPVEPSRNCAESHDALTVKEKPSELVSTGINHISVADSHKEQEFQVEVPVMQPMNNSLQSSSPPEQVLKATQPERAMSPIMTSEPPQGQAAPARISTNVGKPVHAEPALVDSPIQESVTETNSESTRATSPARPQTSCVSEPDYDPFSYVAHNPTKSTFSTTIHRKVVESPPRASTAPRVAPRAIDSLKVPETAQLEPPPTPGIGDLSTLMQDAVTWEALLDGGSLPEPSSADKTSDLGKEQFDAMTKKRVDDARARKQSVRRKRSHGANSAKKKVLASTPEPPVPMPLPPVEPFIIPPPDPGPKRSIAKDLVPDDTSMTSFPPSAFANSDQQRLTPSFSRDPDSRSPRTPSSKSAGKYRYFATLRRLSSFASSPRASANHRSVKVKQRSVSSIGDAPIVIIPSEDGDFGSMKESRASEDKRPSSLYNVGRHNKARSGLFKIWRRTRTRSNASSGASKLTSPSAHSLADPSVLPALHTLDSMNAESTDASRPRPPKRSSSMSSSLLSPSSLLSSVTGSGKNRPPPSSFAPPPQLPPIPSWADAPLNNPTNISNSTSTPLLNLDMFSSFPTILDQRPEAAAIR